MQTTRSDEPIRLVSPFDEAIDLVASGEAWQRYLDRSDLDPSKLVFVGEPAWYSVTALSPRAMAKVAALQPPAPPYREEELDAMTPADREAAQRDIGAYVGECYAIRLRFALVAVESPTWSHARGRYMGVPCWSDDEVWSLGAGLVAWLGMVAFDLSQLDPSKKKPSGS